MVKGDGGIIGVTEKEAALTRWMVKDTDRHHEQIPSVQKTFLSQVKSVIDVLEELGIPFADTSTDLYMLETKRINCPLAW